MPERHLSEEELGLHQDGELGPSLAGHLEWCAECKQRLDDLQIAIAAYAQMCRPADAPRAWKSLAALHDAADSPRRWVGWRIPALAAAAFLAVAAVVVWHHQPDRAADLLARSSDFRPASHRAIAMRVHGRTLLRPAVLTSGASPNRDPDVNRVAALFVQARYSWADPLSARSFREWRDTLREKSDSVTVIRPGTPDQAYRVRTRTGASVLHQASLILTGADLRPESGTFEFEGEPSFEMDEVDESPAPPVAPTLPHRPEAEPERPARPADALHVLAALNRIGADVGEPITVSQDAREVLVSATGLDAARRQEVAAALDGLPHVRLNLNAQPAETGTRRTASERNTTGIPDGLRRQLEQKAGGSVPLQEITDRALESSGEAVSVVRALDRVMAQFPPDVESALEPADRDLLRGLRGRYLEDLRGAVERLSLELQPLLPVKPTAPASSGNLPEAVLQVDAELNRLLAGSYTEAEGQSILRSLPAELDALARRIREARP